MPSTYTLNNGIELIGTGEQSGTWGDTTNTNFELIDAALDGQVTVTLASAGTSGSPNALPISDGASSDGRNRMIIFNDGADLGATAYVQLTPNDAEKIVYIRNDLSGSRSIIVFQGTYSASNDYEIPAGTTAVIYFNGGGAGAVAANVFNNAYFDSLRLGGVSVTAILDEDNMASDSATALATQQSIKAYVDAQVAANNELSEVLANGNTTGGTDIVVSSGDQITTNTISETTAAAGVTIDGVLLKDNGITATGGGSLTGTWSNLGSVTTVDINGGTIDGVTIGGSSAGAITGTTITGSSFVTTGDMTFGDNDKAIFGAGSDLQIYHTGSYSLIADTSGTGPLRVVTNTFQLNNAADTENMINAAEGGAVTLYNAGAAKLATTSTGVDVTGTVTADGLTVENSASNYLSITRDGATGHYNFTSEENGSSIQFFTDPDGTGADKRLTIDRYGDISFYEDTGTTPKFFWDASAESLGLGTSSPSTRLHFQASSASTYADGIFIGAGTGDLYGLSLWHNTSGNTTSYIDNRYDNASAATKIRMRTQGTPVDAMTILGSGNVGIGTSSPVTALDVRGEISVDYDATYGLRFYNEDRNNWSSIGNITSTGNATANLVFKTSVGEVMRLDSSGNVGIGTSSPLYPLSVRNTSFATVAEFRTIDGTNNPGLEVKTSSAGTTLSQVYSSGASSNLMLETNGSERMRIDSSGRVGIGTTSPSSSLSAGGLHVTDRIAVGSGTVGTPALHYDGDTDTGLFFGTGVVAVGTGGSERMRIDSSGNVGIGVVPSAWRSTTDALQIGQSASISSNNNANALSLTSNSYVNSLNNNVYIATGKATNYYQYDGAHVWQQAGSGTAGATVSYTDAMTLDASGNLLVGKTSSSGALAGAEMRSDGYTIATRDGATPMQVRRLTDSSGDLIEYYTASQKIGSIGFEGGDSLVIQSGTTAGSGLHFHPSQSQIVPARQNARVDAAIDLGRSATRFKDLYLSGGVYLGGTGAANLLDDYETGTWTPVITGATVTGTGIYTSQHGTYVKVGKVVTLNFDYTMTAHTGSGAMRIAGLPFASATTSGRESTGSCMTDNFNFSNSPVSVNTFMGTGVSVLRLYISQDDAGWVQQDIDTAHSLIGSITYITG